ncbi:MAG: beta-lactamase family protein [Anaerolineae bacterium]|nr:beta-lactamase family protein [Anaerolineae bacterium]
MKRALLFFSIVMMLLPGMQIVAQNTDEPISLVDSTARDLDDAMLADLNAYIEDAVERYGVIGASVAVVQHGHVIYTNGFGTTELNGDRPVDSETLFMTGSITKSMTSLVLATEVDEGLLTWDTPVTDVLPMFALSDPAVTPQIRVRDLLNMTSGVAPYDMVSLLNDFTPVDMMHYVAGIPLLAPPGEQWNYSSLMVSLGGLATAKASGEANDDLLENTYFDLVQQRVFDPLSMTASTFDFDSALAEENHAASHSIDIFTGETVTVPINLERFAGSVAPAGAVWSNAEDMARYLAMQQTRGLAPDGSHIVSEENLLATQSVEFAYPDGNRAYGMAWAIDDYHGLKHVGHGGVTLGQVSYLAFLPDADLGVVVLTNHFLALLDFRYAVTEYVYELAFDLEHTADARHYGAYEEALGFFAQAADRFPVRPVTADEAADYVGTYEPGVSVTYDDAGELLLQTAFDEPIHFLAVDGEAGAFFGTGAMSLTTLRFEVDSNGQIAALLSTFIDDVQGTPPARLEKIDAT